MATQILNVGPAYTEDDVAATNPVGAAQILVRTDTPAAQVSASGDNVARRGTNYGAAYATILTSAGAVVDTFGGGTQYTEDAVAAADPVGNVQMLLRKDTLVSEVSADGDNVAQRGTAKGEAYTKDVDLLAAVTSDETASTNSTSTTYETGRVLKNSAGRFYSLTGYNSKTTAQFIQIHNTTTVPADTAVPIVTFRVEPESNFYLDFGSRGRSFSTGISICNSSTGPTKTIGAADCWFDAQVGAA